MTWRRAGWMALYAVLCLAEFLVQWAKGHVEEQLKGRRPPAPSSGGST